MTICLIGAFDTKGTEYAFVRDRIQERGHQALTVNTGVLGSTDLFAVDVEADEVARAGGADLERLRERGDRGDAMRVMTAGAPAVVAGLHERGRIDAVLGMGGTGGTTVVTAAMRALPLSAPTVCVSTRRRRGRGPVPGHPRDHHDPVDRGRGRDQPHLAHRADAGGRRGVRDGRGVAARGRG